MKPSEKLKENMTRLALEALESKEGDRMQQCLDRGADPQRLLARVIELKDTSGFKRLLRMKVDLSAITFDQLKTAGAEFAESAADKGHCVQEFLVYGVTEKNIRYVRAALDNGADIHGMVGSPPVALFHLALSPEIFNQEIADVFLMLGANINVKDHDGNTPLHQALLKVKWQARSYDYGTPPAPLGFLLSNGANPAICDKDGRSAFDIAAAITDEGFSQCKKALTALMLRAVRPVMDLEPGSTIRLETSIPASKSISFKPKQGPK